MGVALTRESIGGEIILLIDIAESHQVPGWVACREQYLRERSSPFAGLQ